ncbi:alpha/beta fold hydrolase [Streptomyces sp. ventii]|uniref:Alpha/beta fold hydrolase n=2 Tax=Streptomyces spiramenti TaxID=2720606 RepID=A0ABX1AKD8_9ACTN|nr:alpha/beta fold hydrolase [Streptomyces spiramenti]NJP66304.1 alpha/beta fold hydrolase [Streptomyces spiramenti]
MVVLAHGWTCDSSVWGAVSRGLGPAVRVVRYDQRGHGRSPRGFGPCGPRQLADDLCAVLEAVVAPGARAVVAGHSMGAMAVVAAGGRAAFRERVAAAALCSTGLDDLAGRARVVPLPTAPLRRVVHASLLRSLLPLGPMNRVSGWALSYATLGPSPPPGAREHVARMAHACERRGRAAWGAVLAELSAHEATAGLAVPTAVVHGTADRLTPPIHAQRTVARLPDPERLVLLRGVGHMTPLENAPAVAAVLRSLADRHAVVAPVR